MVHRSRGVGLRLYRPGHRPVHFEGHDLSSSVVVVSFQPTRWLGRCLDSVVNQADEVVLVDNGSEHGAAATIGRTQGVRVLRLAANYGFASGVNAGVASVGGDVIALLNDDAVASPSWLENSARVLAAGDVAAIAPRILLARRFVEVVLDDEDHWAPGDDRPLGRRLTSAVLDGSDVLGALVGPGVHRLEVGSGGERWRWTAGRRPFYAPISEERQFGGSALVGTPSSGSFAGDAKGPELLLDGKPVPISRVVDLVNSAGSYLRKDGYAGDCGADLPDDDRWNFLRECFAVSGGALVTTASAWARVGAFERGDSGDPHAIPR